jgi:hypothetical protein
MTQLGQVKVSTGSRPNGHGHLRYLTASRAHDPSLCEGGMRQPRPGAMSVALMWPEDSPRPESRSASTRL